jgi:predicted AlkP superfamily pyrophosphatase or phosphodiesterase
MRSPEAIRRGPRSPAQSAIESPRVLRIAAMAAPASGTRRDFRKAFRLHRLLLTTALCLAIGCSSESDVRPPKVVLLGLDGLTFGVLRPLIDAGRLPTFERVIEGGTSGILASEHPLISPPIWTTIVTSRSRKEHGILNFYYVDERKAEHLVDSTQRRRSAIWNWLAPFQKSVGFVGWWASWPAEAVDGWIITDRMARSHWSVWPGGAASTGLTHPPELELELRPFLIDPSETPVEEIRRLGDFTEKEIADLRRLKKPVPFDGLSDLKFAYIAQRAYEEMALHMLERGQPDLTGIFLIANDPLCHSYWHYHQPQNFADVDPADAARLGTVIPRFQEHLDRYLDRLLQQLDPHTTLIIVSDHGFTASRDLKWPTGEHHKQGVFIAYGGPVRAGAEISASIYDIAPTILALLDLPVARDLRGRVLDEIFEPAFTAAFPRKFIDSFEPIYERQKLPDAPSPGDEEMEDLLRSLGYIE